MVIVFLDTTSRELLYHYSELQFQKNVWEHKWFLEIVRYYICIWSTFKGLSQVIRHMKFILVFDWLNSLTNIFSLFSFVAVLELEPFLGWYQEWHQTLCHGLRIDVWLVLVEETPFRSWLNTCISNRVRCCSKLYQFRIMSKENTSCRGGSRISRRRGRKPSRRDANIRFYQIFLKNCINWEHFGP